MEQRNWSVTSRLVGYDRYDTPRQARQLNALYELTRPYTNHFLPVNKRVSNQRDGSRLIRVFDAPQTPYQRVLDSPDVSAKQKVALKQEHATLDVVHLKE